MSAHIKSPSSQMTLSEKSGLDAVEATWTAAGELCLWPRSAGAASMGRLLDALESNGIGPGVHREIDLMLPAGTALRKRRVAARAFDADRAVDLLFTLNDDRPADINITPSIAFFARVSALALEMAAGGRVLPTLAIESAGRAARWRPMPSAEDLMRMRVLAAAIPPVCRSQLTLDSAGRGRGADEIVTEFLQAVADAVTRRSLRGRSLTSNRDRSVEGAWLRALTAPKATINAEPPELARLAAKVDAWHAAGLPPASPVRTCFRLEEPTPAKKPASWTVRFLLQSSADPSLIVPAAEVWSGGPGLSVLGGVVHEPEEVLLADLGRAARVWPQLETALNTRRPTRMRLDSAGAHHFLKVVAPTLVEVGLGVLLPSWWRQRSVRIGVRAKARGRGDAGVGLLGLEGLVDYRWQLAIGDQELTIDDLRRLAALKVPLVQVRGQWVELEPDRLQTAIAFFERHQADGERSATIPELLRIGLGLEGSETALPVLGIQAEGWLGKFLDGGADWRMEARKAPEGFVGALRPYQERGLGWLAFLERLGLGGCLADDMGLGKTVQLLALVQAERGGPTLLICPMSVVGNWQREAERFTPEIKVLVHHGGGRSGADGFADLAQRADLVVTTYGLAARDRDVLATVQWRRVVLDEAQNVKNSESKQAQAVRSLATAGRIALTGTPVENRLSELWSILDFCNPGLLGTKSDFRARFAVPVERYRDETAAVALQRLTRPFVLRRLKTDRTIISDLPEKLEMKVYCNITREQATLYQAILDDMLAKIEETEGIQRKGLVLSTMLRLKQVLNHPALMLGDGSRMEGRSGKLSRLEEILEEAVAEGDRVLCFTQFAEMGAMLKAYLEAKLGREVLFLYGATSKGARDEMVQRFQSRSGPRVFVLSLKAGGTGLNLTAANHVVHFDRWWNPAVEDQATDRAFRIGQRRNVQVRKFICVGTLEERIDQMLEKKRELAERVVGSGEGWLTELSTDELRSIVALSRDAVAEG